MGTETPTPRPERVRAGLPPHLWTKVDDPDQVAIVAVHSTVIAGAGPAGLTAAYELTKHGHSCVVLESEGQLVGGISRTDQYKGYRFDIGGHRFFSKSDEINRLWHEILGDQLITRKRMSRIYYNRKFFHYPLKPLDAFRKLGPIRAGLILASYVKARLGRSSPSGASRTGQSTDSAVPCSTCSSRPIPRRSGGCRPRTSPPTGPPSESRV